MALQDELIRFARIDRGVDYIGTADLAVAVDFIKVQADGCLPDLPQAISMGIVLSDAIVDMLPLRDKKGVGVSYRTHAYDIVNRRLDHISSEMASFLQGKGYQAFPIAAAERVDDMRISGIFSHKLAANLAGLGWIGKSCLLVTPEHGPRVRWATILTDAPLAAKGRPLGDRCGDCTACVDRCPVKAFTGRHFSPDEPREARYLAEKCDRYFRAMEERGDVKVCGMCLYVCPFGRKTGSV